MNLSICWCQLFQLLFGENPLITITLDTGIAAPAAGSLNAVSPQVN